MPDIIKEKVKMAWVLNELKLMETCRVIYFPEMRDSHPLSTQANLMKDLPSETLGFIS